MDFPDVLAKCERGRSVQNVFFRLLRCAKLMPHLLSETKSPLTPPAQSSCNKSFGLYLPLSFCYKPSATYSL